MHKAESTQIPRSITFDFIRHGEPEGGTLYRGSQDDPLSEKGWQQLTSSTEVALSQGVQWQEIISSPMKRCERFAKQLSTQLSVTLSQDHNLRELAFGDLEGMTPKQAWQHYPELLTAMWKDPENNTPPNGEAFGDFCDRIEDSLETIINRQLSQTSIASPHTLLVVHGGVIRAILHRFLNIPASTTFQIEIPFASITRVVVFSHPEAEGNEKPYTLSLTFVNGIRPACSHNG
ncbi:hypothetical protein A9Q99_03450 [Gammaproteobacteria bacterium 45_16_T64]|nr:hypothetical protein A9Q99_03450 [Gammaproteobacteria bacterium 45_16_T64]